MSQPIVTTRPAGSSNRPSRGVPLLVRLAGGVVMIGHGLLHFMGTVLLWHLVRPGDLQYGDIVPGPQSSSAVLPGSSIAILAGTEWLAAALVFVAAGIALIIRQRIWVWLTLGGVLFSLPALIANAHLTAAGIVLDCLLLVVIAAAQIPRMRR
jgi:O-antigen ligase